MARNRGAFDKLRFFCFCFFRGLQGAASREERKKNMLKGKRKQVPSDEDAAPAEQFVDEEYDEEHDEDEDVEDTGVETGGAVAFNDDAEVGETSTATTKKKKSGGLKIVSMFIFISVFFSLSLQASNR